MAKKRILILGARGLLGTVLTKKLSQNSLFSVLTHSHTAGADFKNDLSDFASTNEMLLTAKADICINLLALTDVNLCETDKEKAQKLNVIPVKNIVKSVLTQKLDLKLIQISTDHVYDQKDATETDIKLVNYYAITKYLADEFSQLIDAVVLRTNFFGQSLSSKASFSDWIISSLNEKKSLKGFSDVFFSPLHMETLAGEIERVILNFNPGIYNLGSRDGLSKYEFMQALGTHKGFVNPDITAIKYESANIPIPRPLEMRMNVAKYERTFKVVLPTLLEEIKKC